MKRPQINRKKQEDYGMYQTLIHRNCSLLSANNHFKLLTTKNKKYYTPKRAAWFIKEKMFSNFVLQNFFKKLIKEYLEKDNLFKFNRKSS